MIYAFDDFELDDLRRTLRRGGEPGAENPFGLPEVDPAALPPPAHWGQGSECTEGMTQLAHIHDDFDGHGDPDSGGCGHGTLAWGELVTGKGN